MSRTNNIAPAPPLGWNSWDCFGLTIWEHELLDQAAFMATHLRPAGYEYVVIDAGWMEPNPQATYFGANHDLLLDAFGRIQPTPDRFPSCESGKGFGPIAVKLHDMGLKFGIHVMRGIPRKAVRDDLPIYESPYSATDVADMDNDCDWCRDNVGVDMTHPGGQAWYDGLFRMFADWGIDFVKYDDCCHPYQAAEIEAIARARDMHAPNIVLSFSAGLIDYSPQRAEHIAAHGEMWRVTRDFWDTWSQLEAQFRLLRIWSKHAQPHCWPDADMLPIGRLSIRDTAGGEERNSRFTANELTTLVTLWSIFRSPLMIGGSMTNLTDDELAMLTHEGMLRINQQSVSARELFDHGCTIAWTSRDAETDDVNVALFNLDYGRSMDGRTALRDLDLAGDVAAHDVWSGHAIDVEGGELVVDIPPHGARLVRLRRR